MSRVRVPVVPRSYRRAAAVAVALAVLATSIVDPAGLPTVLLVDAAGPPDSTGVPVDKVGHAMAYVAVASALAYERLPRSGSLAREDLAIVFLVAVAYGAGVEGVQATLPARTADPLDALANAVGAAVGTLPWLRVRGDDRRA